MPTINQSLYGGAVLVMFDPDTHRYTVNGRKGIISVTTALGVLNKPALVYWSANLTAQFLHEKLNAGETITSLLIEEAKKQHTIKKEQAATIGSLVHQWAGKYIKTRDQTLPDDEKVLNGVLAFLRWVKEHNVEFVSSERIVYSQTHDYIGIMDAEAKINGKLCVIDFKTSGSIWNEFRYQTAAYQLAAQEEGSKYDDHRWIARFDKETGNFEVVQYTQFTEDADAFLAALRLKRREKELQSEKR